MSEGRQTGLALLHIHRDIPVSAQVVIERFAKRKKTLSRLRYLKHFSTSLVFTTAAIRLLLMLAIPLHFLLMCCLCSYVYGHWTVCMRDLDCHF